MWKQAWRSYISSLHPRNLRKAYDNGGFFWLIYWLVIYPTLITLGNNETVEVYKAIYLVALRFLPFFLMEWSDIGSKYLMTKMMFLSPMKEEERKEYMKCVLCIKIGVSLFCCVLIDATCSIFYGFSALRMVILGIMIFSIGVAKYISLEAFGKMDKKIYGIVKEKSDNIKGRWVNTVVCIFACVVITFTSILDIGAETSLSMFCKWFIGITTIVLMMLDIKIIFSQYKATIALASDYELTFHILGKVEKKVKFDMFEKKQ